MLKVTNLKKKFGELEVLNGISFNVDKGKIYGFLGENGAGKTTTMNILTGLMNFDEGEIYVDGIDFKKHKRQLLSRIGYLPQDPVFYGYMNAYEYLNFIGEVSGMGRKNIKKNSEYLLNVVKLKDAAKRRVGNYSGGMKQRFGMAVALFNDPEILFLDEPTSALDPEGRAEVLELIEKLKKQGKTIFLSTHILNDVERVCDDVSIISNGKIVISQALEKLKEDYIKPIYDIEFEENCQGIKNILFKEKWISDVIIEKNKAVVFVKDMDSAKKNLFKIVGSLDNSILSFNLRKSNLEDIFLRLVNNNEHI